MTFFDISMKMLRVNFRRYKLYFYCNVFSIMLFYCFAAIFTNRSFMDKKIVDSMISSNIIAPSVFVGIFMILFIPYTYRAFMKNRKHEYGILMTLGMSEAEALTNMLFENCVIAVVSLIGGLMLGTVLSFMLFFFIRRVIGISGLHWYFNAQSYMWTAALYAATILVTLAEGIFGFIKLQLTDLIKEKFRAEKKGKTLSGQFAAGVVLVIVSILVMLKYNHSKYWFVGLALMFVGIYMSITHMEKLENYIKQTVHGYTQRHFLGISFVRQHDLSRKRISFIAIWMIAFSVFFGGLSAVLYPSLIQNALRYSPYDLVYSQIFGKNRVKDSEIKSLLNKNGISVAAFNQLDYLRNGAFNLLPASEVNKNFSCHYQIDKGRFLTVFQYDLNDGYGHNMSSPETTGFQCGKSEMYLRSAGDDVKILFNGNPTFANFTLILNDADYSKIASECRDNWKGTVKLYNFTDWKDSGKGISAVQNYLMKANNADKMEQRYYRASSRIEAYLTAKQSAEFLLFMMAFIVILFCTAADIVIHFKIKSESEEEQRMLSGLNRIGVSADEMLKMIRYKNMAYYIPQAVIGLLIGVFYNYTVNAFYGYAWKAAGFSLIIGIPLLALQMIFVRIYSKREYQSFGI